MIVLFFTPFCICIKTTVFCSAFVNIPHFICFFGLATGASWLCYYRALQDGPASVVVPIDKLSILVTIAFSRIVFHEKLTKKAALGVVCITLGTVLLAVI